ncbi:helix-turn-helix domain-containing protein [Actinotignum sp. GS-2025e]|uniref:helix-turn-helix domain-containing protein n=1 Tax=unclassified Actinotignum TaxID=2632702 RepID=UPI003F47A727
MDAPIISAYRHTLGLKIDALADLLGVSVRTMRAWESGRDPIPEGAAQDILRLVRDQARLAQRMVDSGMIITLPRRRAEFPRGYYVAALARALEVEPDLMAEWDIPAIFAGDSDDEEEE